MLADVRLGLMGGLACPTDALGIASNL